jgi:hypothetical protein
MDLKATTGIFLAIPSFGTVFLSVKGTVPEFHREFV